MTFVTVAPPASVTGTANRVQSRSEDLAVGTRRRGGVAVGHIVLVVLAVFSVVPVYWMFATALRAPENATSSPRLGSAAGWSPTARSSPEPSGWPFRFAAAPRRHRPAST